MTQPTTSSLPAAEALPDAPDVDAAHAAQQAETNAGVARATGVVALGNITSRVLGLAREIALTNLFGASGAVDALKVAITVPLAFYDLLIGGHVNSAVIPVLSEVVTRDGRAALWRLVSVLFSLVTVMLAALVLLLELFAPQIIRLAGGAGFDAQTAQLATDLLRLTAPALISMSLFAVLSGTLYALRRFSLPAFAGAIFNGGVVLTTILLAPPLQIMPDVSGTAVNWVVGRPPEGITAAAIGWLVGALAQLILQLPGLRDAKLRFTINWRHPALRQIIKLYAPVMFSLILDTLVIRPFSYNLASTQQGDGNIAYMAWATTLVQFPQGLVATAISIAILPTLSRQATLIASEGKQAFKDTLGLGLRLAITLIVPAAVGLFVLATPIIALLFQHGAFTAHDTAMTALALRLYLLGLPFAAVDLLLVYAFYAQQDTLTPALIGLVSLVIYMIVALLLLDRFGLFSLMIADSVKHLVHASLSAWLLVRRLDGLRGQRLLLTVGKTGFAALVMGAVAALIVPPLLTVFGSESLPGEFALVLVSGGVSVLVFMALAFALNIEELRWTLGLVLRRLRSR